MEISELISKFEALDKKVPRPAVRVKSCENSTFVDYANNSNNCHHSFVCHLSQGALFSSECAMSTDICDCEACVSCELSYECVECSNCHSCTYLNDCSNCRDVHFSSECRSCEKCFGCVALTNKKYCIYNEQFTEEDYDKRVAELSKLNPKVLTSKLIVLQSSIPVPQHHQRNTENCPYGDYLYDSKNVYWGFNTYWLEDCGYIYLGGKAKDCWDMSYAGGGSGKELMSGVTELCYEMVGSSGCFNCGFLQQCYSCDNCWYGRDLHNCKNCYGCVGLTGKEYCILNKQYTKEEYEKEVAHLPGVT